MKKVVVIVGVALVAALAAWGTAVAVRSKSQPKITAIEKALTTAPSVATTIRAQTLPTVAPRMAVPKSVPARAEITRGSAGYWRLTCDANGVWWFVSPAGKREFLNTVTTVQPMQLGRDAQGARYKSRDYDGQTPEDGNLRAWGETTLRRVRAMGFKGLGAWCNSVFHDMDVPMAQDLNLWKWVNGERNAHRVFDPEFAKLVEAGVAAQADKLSGNKNLVGYYIDNELEWGDSMLGPRIYFDGLGATDPNRVEVVKAIRELWPDLATFNRDWGFKLESWDELEKWKSLPLSFASGSREGNYSAYVRLLSAWLERVAGEYFRVTTSLIRKHDPNHLVLGVRFKGWAPQEIVRASRGFTDAQSLNYYVGDALLDKEMFAMMNRDSGNQPVVITEYSFHALDGRSGNRNTVGFAGQVLDQRARAEGYRLFTSRLAKVPYVVGADWFQWADEPPSGRFFDGEDVDFGMVDVDDHEYEGLAAAVRKVTPKLNAMHASGIDPDYDGWRESYSERPLAQVPYLAKAPELNGELSDWPAEARVANVRHSKTVGLERSRVPLPNVYAGWREEGLYLAFEVFDDDIQGADPKGWWWTKDCVEWWLATRPVPVGQNWYDASCHQFFFVPQDFPVNGVSGTVGRWHRPGDAIADSIVPEPNVKQGTRVLPGRYVVEMLIPAASLNGWDPEGQPRLAFNMHVRNWQHAIDYYWSAPKEMQTQLRPNTWGTLYLLPRLVGVAR